MRTTLDLDADVLEAARALATIRKQTMGAVISELARQSLQQPITERKMRDGVPVLPKPSSGVTTNEFIHRLRDEEGI